MIRKYPIYAADVRSLGGVVSVQLARSRTDAEEVFVVNHVSRGGDMVFRSNPIYDPSQADAAARVLAQFTGAAVDRR